MDDAAFDVLIVGAGLSGIGAAYHLQKSCPTKTYAILEGRERLGGTWDLFRYPGIRSDSDMYTLGYSFRPWANAKAIADGPSILEYVRETAEAYGIDRNIRYGHRVERARWSSEQARWTVDVREMASDRVRQLTSSFLFMCAGYYDYEAGYTPD
ncbi:MAG: NAD(P)/FAD-dependent oxidoreductase, partial [Polyangiaceae bacterium]|nr:NAD(P)/FAD-dependent oxidoreductase [Polyangiaceae bacterium]